jgi:hypothetical protein
MRRGIVALVFRCRIVGGQPGATTEAQELAWLTPARCGRGWTRPTPPGSWTPCGLGPPPSARTTASPCCRPRSLGRAASGSRGGSLGLPPRPGWRDRPGSGGMPDSQPQAPPAKPAPEPSTLGSLIQPGPASLAPGLAPGGLVACHGVHRSRFQGQGSPPGQATRGHQHASGTCQP